MAGYIPAARPVSTHKPSRTIQALPVKSAPKERDFAATVLKGGNKINTRSIATTPAKRLYNTASVRNCFINWDFGEPSTFRTPTSFARREDWAVERLMKFTQARIMINTAMTEKI